MGKGTQKVKKNRESRIENRTLVSLIRDRPDKVLEILDRHGVTFCAGCFLTLSSTIERAAAYHAVPDVERLLKDLEKAMLK